MNFRSVLMLWMTLAVSGAWAQEPVAAPGGEALRGELSDDSPCVSAGGCWLGAEYLHWRMRGDNLPPLVTTSPAGTPINQAGVLGTPGVAVLFGGTPANDDWRSGGRITAGFWLDDDRTLGLEASFFMLEDDTTSAAFSSGGLPILSRPFVDAASNLPVAQRVAFPGDLSGSVVAFDTSEGLLGAGVLLRRNLCCDCSSRVDVLGGYRYLRLNGQVGVAEDLVTLSPVTSVPGTQFNLRDSFATTNEFHGFDFGLSGEFRRGPWVLTVLGKLAVGANDQSADIGGATAVTVPGQPRVASPGGLLALSSNSGQFGRTEFSVVPELGMKLGWQLTDGCRASVGYTLLFWSDVVRPGDQIDLSVNPNLLPPVQLGMGPARPAFSFRDSDLLVHGLSVGLELCY